MTREHREMMDWLCHMFSDRFEVNDTASIPAAQKMFSISNSTPLKLNPLIEGSWLDPPRIEGDVAGSWPSKTKFPKGVSPYRKAFPFKPPARPTDVSIICPTLRKLLEAPKISEAYLDPTVFRSSNPVKLVGTSFPTTDSFQRSGLYDGLYTEEMLNFALSFIPMLKQELASSFSDIDLSAFKFLEKLLALTSLSNQRSYHNQIAALVSNKSGMRAHVLSRFQVPPVTAQILKGSDFAGEGVFGDLPESFLARFSTASGKDLVCTPRFRGASGLPPGLGAQKRTMAQQGGYNKKKKAYVPPRDFHGASGYSRGGGPSPRGARGRGRAQKR